MVPGMPAILGCAYTEQATRLVPNEPGHPYYAVLHSYEMRGDWSALTLHPLLDGSFDVSVVVDVDTAAPQQGDARRRDRLRGVQAGARDDGCSTRAPRASSTTRSA